MQGERTRCMKCYLAPIRSRADREVLSKMLADRSRGTSYSATMRAALVAYYRPTPQPSNGGTDPAVAQALLLLAGHVRDLADEVARLKAEVRELRAELRAAVEG